MKSLIIIRHAKSSWEHITDDFNRPLNERGKNDAPVMAERLQREKLMIDAFISSPAKRAKKTAEIFTNEFKRNKEEIIFLQQLYNAPTEVFYTVVTGLDNRYTNVAIFAHNPGVTSFANSLTTYKIDDMPTCSMFGVKIYSDLWTDFETARKEFLFFNYPRLKS